MALQVQAVVVAVLPRRAVARSWYILCRLLRQAIRISLFSFS
jgi:hypothetical protein